ncbi:hypothetical protein HNR42_002541 [Deinobacterium chartae]|uniref:Outer membrane protein beta-barrel domain-containing protein n=1 Tax=Deinobacterium chartae TaxID=521158 RepID=A0A841I5F2_9DEIO|nr:hypothetical protein [Deinobacterium chartae]MBB6099105.1 hypothetical protein [Deinobacterium chartae]
MKKLVVISSLALLAAGASASPSAYVEPAFEFNVNSRGDFGVGLEVPLHNFPVDASWEANLTLTRGFDAEVAGKALLFPSLLPEPPLAVALRGDLEFGERGLGLHLGPLASLDFSPLTLNAGLYPGFKAGRFDLKYHLGVRYYFDNNALDLAWDSGALKLGARLAF